MESKAADAILVDKTGPVSACLWGSSAEALCNRWRQAQERRSRGVDGPCCVDLTKVRIQGAAKSNWNGESLTRIRTLTSIENTSAEGGTQVKLLAGPTSANLTSAAFRIPPADCCISAFRFLRNRLNSPFRLTIKGRVADLQSLEQPQGGNAKRVFDIVDIAGLYITCCAMKHNVDSSALRDNNEVVIYFGTGRGPLGNSKGMLYLMKDSFIVGVSGSTTSSSPKTEQLSIE